MPVGSYITVSGVQTMMVPVSLTMLSWWLLLVLAWKPVYYVLMYFYGLFTKNNVTAVTYGAKLHDWLVQLWGLVV